MVKFTIDEIRYVWGDNETSRHQFRRTFLYEAHPPQSHGEWTRPRSLRHLVNVINVIPPLESGIASWIAVNRSLRMHRYHLCLTVCLVPLSQGPDGQEEQHQVCVCAH